MPKIARFIIWISSKFTKPEIEQIVTSKLPSSIALRRQNGRKIPIRYGTTVYPTFRYTSTRFSPAIRPELTAKPADAPVEPLIA